MPVYGVILSAVIAGVLTLPALVEVDINGAPVPVAFFAVVSIGVIGLYLAFAIPIYLTWKAGDAFHPGSWNLGSKYRWMCVVAVVEIAITSIIVVPGALILLWTYWHASVKNWFTGPKTTIDQPVLDPEA